MLPIESKLAEIAGAQTSHASNPPMHSPRSRWQCVRRRSLWLAVAGVVLLGTLWSGREAWSWWQEQQAVQSFQAEDYDRAHACIERALRVRSNRLTTNFLAARIERARHAYPEAERFLVHAKELGGMTPQLQLEWLLLRCEKGYVDELAPELLAAVQQNHPDSSAILEAMALVYMRQTRYPAALNILDQWLERAPDSTRALEWRGWVGNQLDRRGQAIDDYTRVLELQPGNAGVRLRLAELLVESSRHAEALPLLEELFRSQPTNPDVLVGLAACRVVQLRRGEAEQLLKGVLASHPEHFGAILALANLEREEGHYAAAEQRLRKALELKPLDPTTRYSLHLTLLAQPGRAKEAEEARQRWEADREATARITQLLRGQLAERPTDPNLPAEAGELFFRQGEYQRGLFWFNKALQIDPNHQPSHQALAAYYERINDPVQAQLHRNRLKDMQPR